MKRKFLILALLASILCACKNNDIDKSIVLKIGKLEITKYEFDKNKTRGLLENNDSSALTNSDKVLAWKKEFIDRCYIITDAYEKKYDTISEIQKQIQYTGDYMMAQRYGYLWKKTISPIVDAAKTVTDEKIVKRKKLCYFDLISCNSKELLIKATNNDTVLKNKESFLKLKSKCIHNGSFKSGYLSAQWPFLAFWDYREYLFNMKEGQVSKLMSTGHDYFYLYLDHIEEIMITPEEKEKILTELQLGTEGDLIKKSKSEMNTKCHPVMNEANIEIISQFLEKGNTIFQFHQDIELIKYNIDNKLHKVGFKKFLEYYSNQLIRSDIKNKESLIVYINEYYNDDYLINEAKKLDLYNSDIYKLDRKNFQNNLLYGKYIDEEIAKRINIDSLEIVTYYSNNTQLFKQPKYIIVGMYVFNNINDVDRNKGKISFLLSQKRTEETKDTADIKGLYKYISNFKIDMENSGSYSKEFIHELSETKIGQVAQMPVLFQNKYVLLNKNGELGASIKKLKDVYSYIDNKIRNDKIAAQIQELVKQLKTRYKVEIDKTGI